MARQTGSGRRWWDERVICHVRQDDVDAFSWPDEVFVEAVEVVGPRPGRVYHYLAFNRGLFAFYRVVYLDTSDLAIVCQEILDFRVIVDDCTVLDG